MKTARILLASLAFAAASSMPVHAQSTAAIPYELVSDPGIPLIATQHERDEAVRLLSEYLALSTANDVDTSAYARLIEDGAVFEYTNHPRIASDAKFDDLKLIETPYRNVFFVEYRVTAKAGANGKLDETRHLARITVHDGKIAGYYETRDRNVKG